METIIRYGMIRNISRAFSPDYTVGELLRDRGILMELGAPEGCQAVAHGETLGTHEHVSQYDRITLEKQAANKA
jgi:hypothetical protein